MSDEVEHPMPEDEASAATRLTGPRDTLPDEPLAQVADPVFAPAMRGYDRAAVDAYVERVTRLVAELQATASPRIAVREALERVGEETTSILRRAHEAADAVTSAAQAEALELSTRSRAEADELANRTRREADALTARSQAEADERLEEARREVAGMIAEAQQRAQDLDRDADLIWAERARLIDDVRRVMADLEQVAADADARYPAGPADEEPPEAPAPVAPVDFESFDRADELEGTEPAEPAFADEPEPEPPDDDPQATREMSAAELPEPLTDLPAAAGDPDTAEFPPAPEVEPTARRGMTARWRQA
jgi:DivIVA domain-containing protein